MKQPEGYAEAKAATGEGFKQLPPGGYICKIRAARETLTQSGRNQLEVAYDIVEGEYKGYFGEQYDRMTEKNLDAKWPGVVRQLTEGTSLPFFKGMITAIVESNPGYVWDFDEQKLKGKLFGAIMREEEYEKNGKVFLTTRCAFIRSVDSIRQGKFTIPEVRRLKTDSGAKQGANQFGKDVAPDDEIQF